MFDYKKDGQSINHVHCDVKNCIHNGHNCNCTAKEIKVGPHQASSCSDTVCQSFVKR